MGLELKSEDLSLKFLKFWEFSAVKFYIENYSNKKGFTNPFRQRKG